LCCSKKKSVKLKRVLEVVLAFGNFLNHNSSRGGCWGYKLKDLTKLVDVRSVSDPQKTMMYFIVEYMEISFPTDCDFYNDLKPLEEVSNLQQLTFVHDELLSLKEGIKLVEDFYNSPGSDYGNFRDAMVKFIPSSKKLVEKIDELLDKGEKLFKEMVLYFGESPATTLDEFFGDISRFSRLFEKSRTEIHRKKELEIRQKARQEQIEKQKHEQQNKMPVGRLERALADLTSGSAYTPGKSSVPIEKQVSPDIRKLQRRQITKSTPTTPSLIKSPQSNVILQKDQLTEALAFLKKKDL